MTTNQSESLNAMLKRFAEGGEMPIDVTALAMYRLFNSFNTQIERARYRVGEDWTLLKELEEVYDVDRDRPQLNEFRSPEKIVDDIKMAYKTVTKMVFLK